jgi:hypothetical protein
MADVPLPRTCSIIIANLMLTKQEAGRLRQSLDSRFVGDYAVQANANIHMASGSSTPSLRAAVS